MNKKGRSPTEVTQVSTCVILQYEQTRPFSHGSDSSKYMCYLTIWTKKAVLPRKWLKWVHVLSYNMNKPGRSPTEVTQVSTCVILQYEQKRPFSHWSDSSKYMCYLTIWTPGRSPTEVTQVSTCTILQYEQTRPFSHGSDSSKYMYYLTIWTNQAVLTRKWLKWVHCAILQYEQKRPFSHGKWLKWVHVLSYNMNKKGHSPHWSDSSEYMCYLTIWTNQSVLPRKWLK